MTKPHHQPRPTDTDFYKERLRDTIYTIVAVLLGLFFIWFIVSWP